MSRKIKVLAHRGYRAKYPENTLLSFKKGFEYGADGLECDVQKTKDGKYVIIHDETVDRTAKDKKKGVVLEMTLKKLKSVDLGKKQTIPELHEFLASIPEGKYVNMELKDETLASSDGPELLEIFLKYVKKEDLLVSSFDHSLLDHFRDQRIPVGLLMDEGHMSLGFIGIMKRIIKYQPKYMNLPIKMFEKIGISKARILIKFFRIMGCGIAFWTVNSKQEFEYAYSYGDIIMTDEVEFILDELKKKESC